MEANVATGEELIVQMVECLPERRRVALAAWLYDTFSESQVKSQFEQLTNAGKEHWLSLADDALTRI